MSRGGQLDRFQRANYLFQLSHAALRAGGAAVSRHYSRLLTEVAHKSVLRLDRGLKRQLCRACRGLLVPGVTCTVRTRRRPQPTLEWRCLACGTCRRLPSCRPTGHRRSCDAQAARMAAEMAELEAANVKVEEGQVATRGEVGQREESGPLETEGEHAQGSQRLLHGGIEQPEETQCD